ncbi:retrotransposon protein, putative, ty1-copia subclass [Tanacetum coccineum]
MSCNLFLEHSFGSDATITKLSFDQILFLTSGGAFRIDDMGQKLEKERSVLTKFIQIVAAIEQFADLNTITFQEATERLKAYEERIKRPRKKMKSNQDNKGRSRERNWNKDGQTDVGGGGDLRSMLEKQAGVKKFDLIQSFHACKQEEGKTIGEIHAMLIEYEKGLPKKVETPQVMMIKSGKIQKANKKSLNAKGKNKVNGKGKDKKEVGHWKKNCHVFLAELQKKRKQVGSASSSISLYVRKEDLYVIAVAVRGGQIYEFRGYKEFAGSKSLPYGEGYGDLSTRVDFDNFTLVWTSFETAVEAEELQESTLKNDDERFEVVAHFFDYYSVPYVYELCVKFDSLETSAGQDVMSSDETSNRCCAGKQKW